MKRYAFALVLSLCCGKVVAAQEVDFDGNGRVDLDDFFLFADFFGQSADEGAQRYDLNADGLVDLADFFFFADRLGEAAAPADDEAKRGSVRSDAAGRAKIELLQLGLEIDFLVLDVAAQPLRAIDIDFEIADDQMIRASFSDGLGRFAPLVFWAFSGSLENPVEIELRPVVADETAAFAEEDVLLDRSAFNRLRREAFSYGGPLSAILPTAAQRFDLAAAPLALVLGELVAGKACRFLKVDSAALAEPGFTVTLMEYLNLLGLKRQGEVVNNTVFKERAVSWDGVVPGVAGGLEISHNFAGMDLANRLLNGADFSDADLSGTNFGGSNLHSANFSGADMRGANMRGANLAAANFQGTLLDGVGWGIAAVMPSANFSGADLRGRGLVFAELRNANFSGAKLNGVNFSNSILLEANFNGADLSGAIFERANLVGADFTGATLRGATLAHAELSAIKLANTDLNEANLSFTDLTGLDLSGSDFSDAVLEGTIWTDGRTCYTGSVGRCLNEENGRSRFIEGRTNICPSCDLQDLDLRHRSLSRTDLTRADLSYVNLSGVDLRWANLGNAVLKGANLQGADLRSASLWQTDFTDADLSQANLRNAIMGFAKLEGANLEGADLSFVTWPTGGRCLEGSIGTCKR